MLFLTIFSTLLTSFILKRIVNEFRSRIKELAEVESGEIICLHSMVLHSHVFVIFWSRVHIPLPMSCIEDVSEACLLQAVAI